MEDPITQISLADARMVAPRHVLGDIVQIPIDFPMISAERDAEREERDLTEDPRREP